MPTSKPNITAWKVIVTKFDLMVVALSITLLNVPNIFSDTSPIKMFAYVLSHTVLWVVVIKNMIAPLFTRKIKITVYKKNRYLEWFIVIVLMYVVAYFRAYIYSTLKLSETIVALFHLLTIILFAVSVFIFSDEKNYCIRYGIWLSLSLYVFINVVLQVAGFANPHEIILLLGTGQSQLASIFGFTLYRDQFPIAVGLNNFGLIAGISLLVSLLVLVNEKKTSLRVAGLLSLFSSFYAMLIVDSRANFILVFVVFIILVSTPIKLKSGISYLVLFAPLMLGVMYLVLINLPPDIMSLIARTQDADDLYTMSDRTIIWYAIIDKLKQFTPVQLFGYGIYGQTTSGVSQDYLTVFNTWLSNSSERFSAHNFSLQSILDIGYVGFLLVLVYYYTATRYLITLYCLNKDQGLLYLCSIVVYTMLTGSTEISGTVYYPEVFMILIFILVFNIGLHGIVVERITDSSDMV